MNFLDEYGYSYSDLFVVITLARKKTIYNVIFLDTYIGGKYDDCDN